MEFLSTKQRFHQKGKCREEIIMINYDNQQYFAILFLNHMQ